MAERCGFALEGTLRNSFYFWNDVKALSVLRQFPFEATGGRTPLTRFEGRTSLGPPSVSADGRIVFARMTEQGWNLALLETDGTVRALTEDTHFNYAPRWLDAHRIGI